MSESSSSSKLPSDKAFRRFLRRTWRNDVAPILRGRRADQRRRSARIGGKIAATAGLAIDSLFHLRGRPFTRALTVMGATAGAILPDAWDIRWFRKADRATRDETTRRVQAAAGALPEADALELFGLDATADRDELKRAWRAVSKRWHPDLAPDGEARGEYHLRFVAYQAAYELLRTAYDENRLPRNAKRTRD